MPRRRRLVPGEIDEVLAGHHGFDARQRQGLVEVDRLDARVRMRAAQHLAVQHAGLREVGAEGGAAGDLLDAVGPDRALADPLVARTVVRTVACHRYLPVLCASAEPRVSAPEAYAWVKSKGSSARPHPIGMRAAAQQGSMPPRYVAGAEERRRGGGAVGRRLGEAQRRPNTAGSEPDRVGSSLGARPNLLHYCTQITR